MKFTIFYTKSIETSGKNPLLNLYIVIPILCTISLSIVNVLGSLKIGAV